MSQLPKKTVFGRSVGCGRRAPSSTVRRKPLGDQRHGPRGPWQEIRVRGVPERRAEGKIAAPRKRRSSTCGLCDPPLRCSGSDGDGLPLRPSLPVGCETQTGEADRHHCPSGGLRDGYDQCVRYVQAEPRCRFTLELQGVVSHGKIVQSDIEVILHPQVGARLADACRYTLIVVLDRRYVQHVVGRKRYREVRRACLAKLLDLRSIQRSAAVDLHRHVGAHQIRGRDGKGAPQSERRFARVRTVSAVLVNRHVERIEDGKENRLPKRNRDRARPDAASDSVARKEEHRATIVRACILAGRVIKRMTPDCWAASDCRRVGGRP
jgi:hypothetical protein